MLRMILRLDTFELPEIRDDEILVKVVSDSICMSAYKCAILGTEHKRTSACIPMLPSIRPSWVTSLRAISSRLARSIRINSSRA